MIEVDRIHIPHKRSQHRQHTSYVFTRLQALRLGNDGDLGCGYEKIVVLDADVLPLRDFGSLFTLDCPAGIVNERKEHFVELDPQGRQVFPEDLDTTGTWVWHRVYNGVCPHGRPVPREITDRVLTDPSNLGINGSLFVLEPSAIELERILLDVERPEVRRLVRDLYEWPDMQYLTGRWSGKWTSVDVSYSGFAGYPGLRYLRGTHFAGVKPWYFKREKTMARFSRYEDFQHWYRVFTAMMRDHERSLGQNRRLVRLLDSVRAMTADRRRDHT